MSADQDDSPFAGLDRASRAAAVITGALAELGEDRRWLIPWIAKELASRSIASKILAFATGPTAGCSGGTACARLYLALQGYPADLRDTNTAFDLTRQQWWLSAMFEFQTGRWRGCEEGVRAIAAKHPAVWKEAQAVRLTREKVRTSGVPQRSSSDHARDAKEGT